MPQKILKFDDNSLLLVEVREGGKVFITLQARHVGENRITSSSIELTNEEAVDLIGWITDELAL